MTIMQGSVTSIRIFLGALGVFHSFTFVGVPLDIVYPYTIVHVIYSALLSTPLGILSLVLETVWGFGYLYFSFALPRYLTPVRVKYVKIFLLLPLIETALLSIASLVLVGDLSVLSLIGGGIVTGYLYKNVDRLGHQSPALETSGL